MKPWLWFRVYSEIADDVKLLTVAPSDRWFFVALLACKAQGLLEGEDAERRYRHVCLKLRLDRPELEELARRLDDAGLIDQTTLQPLAWDDRQFVSDHDPTASDRLKKYREKKRLERETEMKRVSQRTCNGDETEPEAEAETETEQRKDVVPTVLGGNGVSTPPLPPKENGYRLPPCPYSDLIAKYHERLPACPRIEVLSEQRKRHLQARWKQVCADEKLTREQGIEWFDDFFTSVAKSHFLTGKTKPRDGRRPFFASLDWLMSAEKFVHVYEGKYA